MPETTYTRKREFKPVRYFCPACQTTDHWANEPCAKAGATVLEKELTMNKHDQETEAALEPGSTTAPSDQAPAAASTNKRVRKSRAKPKAKIRAKAKKRTEAQRKKHREYIRAHRAAKRAEQLAKEHAKA